MYDTYVPITETIVERRPPTIAEIVRQKTDDGARIIDFFLDLMEGRVDDARLCHRIDAAKQLVKYGYKKAAEFIAEHGDETCDHCESRKRGPRPRKDQSPPAGPPYAAPHLTPDFLTLLTEDFFAVLSAVDEDLMIKLVRGQTRDGDAIVEFLDDVMEGRNDSFKPNHRISAAKELISHILRDEHRSHTSGVPARKIVVPAKTEPALGPLKSLPLLSPLKGRYGDEGDSSPFPLTGEGWGEGDSSPSPLTGEGWGEGDSPDTTTTTVAPAHTTVVPAKAEPAPYSIRGTQRGGEGRRSHPSPVHHEPVLATAEGPVEGAAEDNDDIPAPAELIPARRRIREKLVAHRHDPDAYGAPIDSTHPGRSPPG